MKLLELELTGFKSFATKTRFVFENGITAIIGPNGSGKSNFAESIRWVLGEQSLKSIRGRKTEDVIFAGSSSANRKGSAQVALTFDNESGRLGVDASEVQLKRTITRDGEGEYAVNGDPVRLFDTQQLLAEAGLGTKSYAVISQGTVDRYLTATPQARRELFDEATGVKALQLKLGKAETKLKNATQREYELTAIVKELRPRLRILQRQAEKFVLRDKVAEEFANSQRDWFAHAWHQQAADVQTALDQQQTTGVELNAARTVRDKVEGQLLDAAGVMNTPAPLTVSTRPTQRLLWQMISDTLAEAQRLLAESSLNELKSRLQEAQEIVAKAQATNESLTKNLAPPEAMLKGALGEARAAELQAERDHSTAQTILAHAKEELITLETDIRREQSSTFLEELKQASPSETMVSYEEVQALSAKLASIGDVDPLVLKEYEEVAARYNALTEQLTDIVQTRTNTSELMRALKRDIDEQFKAQFLAIQKSFSFYFEQLFDGGTAKLEMIKTRPNPPLSGREPEENTPPDQGEIAGVDISAHPPSKKLQHIGALSGGEKALTSLALLLAIISVQEPPFIVLDEVDAALDEANSYRFAEALQEIARTTQVIVVTHNRETMGVADVLYGITMNEDSISQVYSVKMEDLVTSES